MRAASGSTSSRARCRAAESHPAAAPAERDPSVAGRPQVVEQRAAVGDRLASRPAELLDHVGHRLRDDHVARRDGVREPEAVEADRGAVHGEHRRPRPDAAERGDRDRVGRAGAGRSSARGGGRPPRSPSREGRARAAQGGRSRDVRRIAPPRKPAIAAAAQLLGADRRGSPRGRRGRRTPRSRRPRSRAAPRSSRRRACGAARYQASTPVRSHHSPIPRTPRSDARDDRERALVADAVAQDRQVVPQRRDEAAVPAARPVPGEPGLEHDDVERRLELLQLPRGPQPEVAAAHDHDVRGRVARERRRRLDRPGLLEPPAVPRVPHPVHRARA